MCIVPKRCKIGLHCVVSKSNGNVWSRFLIGTIFDPSPNPNAHRKPQNWTSKLYGILLALEIQTKRLLQTEPRMKLCGMILDMFCLECYFDMTRKDTWETDSPRPPTTYFRRRNSSRASQWILGQANHSGFVRWEATLDGLRVDCVYRTYRREKEMRYDRRL